MGQDPIGRFCPTYASQRNYRNKTKRLTIISSHIIECLRSVLSDSHAYIDEDRSFIELGLDSLLLTKMLRALRSMLNGAVPLTTADIFNNPSVKAMSEYLT